MPRRQGPGFPNAHNALGKRRDPGEKVNQRIELKSTGSTTHHAAAIQATPAGSKCRINASTNTASKKSMIKPMRDRKNIGV